ncbi:MAG: hypothetical protein ACW992_14015 [Candidatus Thorarchaeota archaeon]
MNRVRQAASETATVISGAIVIVLLFLIVFGGMWLFVNAVGPF